MQSAVDSLWFTDIIVYIYTCYYPTSCSYSLWGNFLCWHIPERWWLFISIYCYSRGWGRLVSLTCGCKVHGIWSIQSETISQSKSWRELCFSHAWMDLSLQVLVWWRPTFSLSRPTGLLILGDQSCMQTLEWARWPWKSALPWLMSFYARIPFHPHFFATQ